MLIKDELKSLEAKLRRPEPAPIPNFKSLLNPLQAGENEGGTEKRLCHFDLLVHKKRSEPPFFQGTKKQTWELTHRGDKWRTDETGQIEYLLKIIINHYKIHTMMILYDNSLPGKRDNREIFKLLHNEVKVNRLCEYGSIITIELPEWMSYEVK